MSKYTCEISGLEDCFIEIDDFWNRQEIRDFWKFQDESYLELLQKKTLSCYLICPGNNSIQAPQLLTTELMDKLDIRLVKWVSFVPVRHVQDLVDVGEVLGRKLLGSIETN